MRVFGAALQLTIIVCDADADSLYHSVDHCRVHSYFRPLIDQPDSIKALTAVCQLLGRTAPAKQFLGLIGLPGKNACVARLVRAAMADEPLPRERAELLHQARRGVQVGAEFLDAVLDRLRITHLERIPPN